MGLTLTHLFAGLRCQRRGSAGRSRIGRQTTSAAGSARAAQVAQRAAQVAQRVGRSERALALTGTLPPTRRRLRRLRQRPIRHVPGAMNLVEEEPGMRQPLEELGVVSVLVYPLARTASTLPSTEPKGTSSTWIRI